VIEISCQSYWGSDEERCVNDGHDCFHQRVSTCVRIKQRQYKRSGPQEDGPRESNPAESQARQEHFERMIRRLMTTVETRPLHLLTLKPKAQFWAEYLLTAVSHWFTLRGMGAAPPPPITSDVSRLFQDFTVSATGAATSFVTAAILVAIERSTGFSYYTLSFLSLGAIPVGAVLSGFVGASGYYLGARLFNHRPTKILLLNMVVISVATFFLIHYFHYYYFLTIEGKPVRDFISFVDFLRIELSHNGAGGYLYAALQVIGFAAGGLAVFGYLNSLPYCEKCAKYLSAKDSQTRCSLLAYKMAETTKTLCNSCRGT
jgi:hypothetical protein